MSNSVFVCVRDCLWYACNTLLWVSNVCGDVNDALQRSLCCVVCCAVLPLYHATMAIVDDVSEYMSGCARLIETQRPLLPADVLNDNILRMFVSCKSQIDTMSSLPVADAVRLDSELHTSAFTDAHRSQLATAIMQKVAGGRLAKTDDAKRQTMHYPYNYLTQSDWTHLEDLAKIQQQCACRVRSRLQKAGFVFGSEHALGNIACMIAAVREPDMSSIALHSLLQDVKNTKGGPLTPTVFVVDFPEDAKGLPDALYTAAYSEEPPLPKTLPGYIACVNRMPLRSSHNTLKRSRRRLSPSPSPPKGDEGSHEDSLTPVPQAHDISTFAQIMAGFMQQLQAATGQLTVSRTRNADQALVYTDGSRLVKGTRRSPSLETLDFQVSDASEGAAVVESDVVVQLAPPVVTDADDVVAQLETIAGGGACIQKKPASATTHAKAPAIAKKQLVP